MKASELVLAMALFGSMPLVACKPKKIEVTEKKKSADTIPLLRSDVWQGKEDRVDPQLGSLKTLDK